MDEARPEAAGRTGDIGVDAALQALGGLSGGPVERHAEVFDRLHDALRAELDAEADDR